MGNKNIRSEFYVPHKVKTKLDCYQFQINEIQGIKTQHGHEISTIIAHADSEFTNDKYIVYSHGPNDDLSCIRYSCKRLALIMNCHIISYDYIGYGQSHDLCPTLDRCYDSLCATMCHVLEVMNIPTEKVLLIGESIGAQVVAKYVATNNWKSGIVMISPTEFSNVFKQIRCPIKIFHKKNTNDKSTIIYKYLKKKFVNVWLEKCVQMDIFDNFEYADFQEILY